MVVRRSRAPSRRRSRAPSRRSRKIKRSGTYKKRSYKKRRSPARKTRRTTHRSSTKRYRKSGKVRSRNVIGKLRKGTLSKHGYTSNATAASRHTALAKAVRAYGALSVFRKLNAVAVLTKNTSPLKSKRFVADRNWVKRTYM